LLGASWWLLNNYPTLDTSELSWYAAAKNTLYGNYQALAAKLGTMCQRPAGPMDKLASMIGFLVVLL
jgi:hypothetical protein